MKRLDFVAFGLTVLLHGCKQPAPEEASGLKGPRVDMKRVIQGEAGVGGVGQKISGGTALDLRANSTGEFVTYLLEAEKPRLDGLPPPLRVGELWSVSVRRQNSPGGGAAPRKLGNGVTNQPGGYLFSPDGRWVLMLVGYNAAEQTGELQVADLQGTGGAEPVGGRVSYMIASDDSKQLAFVEEGSLKVGPLPKGPFVEVAAEVATAQFAPDGSAVYFRRRVASAGGLYQVAISNLGKPPKKLADQVGDFRLTPDGRTIAYAARPSAGSPTYDLFIADTSNLKSRELTKNVITFRFSPDAKWLAYNVGLSPEDPGDLFVAASAGGKPRQVGAKVNDFQFSPDSKSIAYREGYAYSEGELAVSPLEGDGPSKKVHKHCRSFRWSDDSQKLAFTVRFTKPIVSIDLLAWRVGDEAPTKVKTWVYDYDFTKESDRLLFRSDCIREGRSCDLLAVDLKDLIAPPKKLVEAMMSFKLSVDGSRVLVTYARAQQGDLVDVAVYNLKSSQRKTLDQFVRLPPLFLADDGSRVAYVIAQQEKGGVYLVDAVP